MGRGINTLGGKHGESRQVRSGADFDGVASAPKKGGDDFIALDDSSPDLSISTYAPQSQESPGEVGSPIPGIDGFDDPQSNSKTAAVFKHVYFDYNSSLLKGDSNLVVAQNIAAYMQRNPNLYVFIEGHCDKRGPAAYNYALGANRSNSVRNILIQEGVDQDHIFTISYGKDKILVDDDSEEAHRQNRRCQFKIFAQ